jgi:hypothetical protein
MLGTVNTIEETVRLAQFGLRRITKIHIKNFEKDLPKDEKLLAVGFDMFHPKNQVYVTDKRIIFIKIFRPHDVKRKNILIKHITAVDFDKFGTFAMINIATANENEGIGYIPIHIGQEINLIVEKLMAE